MNVTITFKDGRNVKISDEEQIASISAEKTTSITSEEASNASRVLANWRKQNGKMGKTGRNLKKSSGCSVCGNSLPTFKHKYCSPRCAKQAHRKRARASYQRKKARLAQ